ncbi:MAG: metallophosphoesterase [Clostridia bacterium]|nr:metallophosphoesterase [Clostridia bacterium]
MQNVSNIISQAVSKSLTSVFGGGFLLSAVRSGFKGKKTIVPSDFAPVIRFAVCSDIHLNGEEGQEAAARFSQLFDDMYNYASDCAYNRLDAVMVAGDFSGGGAEKQYVMYNKITKEKLRKETQLLTVIGNHEFIDYRDVDATVGYTVYKKYVSDVLDTDVIINGYHFIGVAYDDNGKTFTGKVEWLKERLNNAVKENPDMPIFVYQHPHPFLTVYGSVNWGDRDLRKVLNNYPQVVDFSGHSHYCPADPRSVWQGAFTAVGCGSLSAFMGNLNYIEGDKDAPGKSGGAWVVECDKNGNILMQLYDIENRQFFSDVKYYFTDLTDKSKRTYNWHKQKSLDTAPVFEKGASVTVSKNEDGESVISFPEAKGFYEAENYKITLLDSNKKSVFEKTVISDYVRATENDVFVNVGKLSSGEYTVKINSYSPYAKKGEKLIKKVSVK